MPDSKTQPKFPRGSAPCEYDVFEAFTDGTTAWRACVSGMENVDLKFRELARASSNSFFALNLQDRTQPVVRSIKADAKDNLRRAS